MAKFHLGDDWRVLNDSDEDWKFCFSERDYRLSVSFDCPNRIWLDIDGFGDCLFLVESLFGAQNFIKQKIGYIGDASSDTLKKNSEKWLV